MNFEVEEVRRVPINRFGIIETLYNINYDTLMMSFEEADTLIREMLKEFVRVFTARMLENDMIAVVFDHDDFNFSITIPFMKKKDFTVAVIQEAFFRVAQSYKYSLLSRHRNLRAYVQIQKIPVGGGRRALQPHEKKKYIPKKVEKEKKVDKVKTRIKN